LRLVVAIENPAVARRILECIGLPARAPPLAARVPDSNPTQPSGRAPDAGWEFDQTPPDDGSWA
jgi:hypothetical protein